MHLTVKCCKVKAREFDISDNNEMELRTSDTFMGMDLLKLEICTPRYEDFPTLFVA